MTCIMQRVTLSGVFVLLGVLVTSAQAQYRAKPRPFDGAGGGSARRPAISPYMNLINNNNGIATNYQSLVRPALEQNNFNAKSASAIRGLQRQAAQSASRSTSTYEGNVKMRATGHAAARENYSHYYPQLGRR
ncbi:MAG TPA: hypothetical protein VHD36_14330 [Pirellulales bacterium]|nr:hypothetical protein [Pirellulales bacterium]